MDKTIGSFGEEMLMSFAKSDVPKIISNKISKKKKKSE
jgi:hypothetical protein